ncbi:MULTISPECIES: hypothetical protein [Bradyrhizobium]|uniref:hypothetical protein n=1 Tax=Bradyrhizobium TaxID=374 RepID=UPI00115FC182|nr:MULTISPECIES: hypothetical protein [Bradyrhizobium]
MRHARGPLALLASRHDDASDHRNLAHSGRTVFHRHLRRDIDELIPSAIIFFAVAAALGWIGNKFWPEDWIHNPLL